MGGKSANIICGDADIDFAVQQACILFGNCGQSCVAGSRTYVHESIYDKVVEGSRFTIVKTDGGMRFLLRVHDSPEALEAIGLDPTEPSVPSAPCGATRPRRTAADVVG